MPRHPIALHLIAAVLLLGGSFCAVAQQPQGAAPTTKVVPGLKIQPVDINSASREQLKTLPGIGDAEADRIIANRPYLTKAKLAVDKVLPMATYWGLKGRIVAVQKASPKKKTKSPAKTETPPKAQP